MRLGEIESKLRRVASARPWLLYRPADILTALLLVTAAISTGCAPDRGSTGIDPAETLTIALGSEPTTLDPQVRDDGGERAVNDNIYETLMVRTQDGSLVPGLAAERPTQVESATWEFRLRPGVQFHNGEPFNAASVVASIKRIVNPRFNSEQVSYFSTIEDAKELGELTLQITTKGPDPILPSRMYWMKMVPPKYSETEGFAENPVGTGPYRFVSWDRGSQILLEANPNYWDGEPAIKRVTYRFVEELGTKLSGLFAGEFDLVRNLLPEFLDQVPKGAHIQGPEIPVVILSAVSGPTKDLRVRKALNYAVDKQALAGDLFGGYAQVANGQLLAPTFLGYTDTVAPYSYDPEKAKRLLAEAGASGATIELIGTSGRWLKDRELIEAIAGYWQAAGLEVNVRMFEFDEYLNRLFDRQTRADALFFTSSNELFDADRPFTAYLHAQGIGSSNDDQELATLIDRARTETDPPQRKELYAQAVRRTHDQAYLLWLLYIEDIYGMSERLDWQPRVDAKMLVKEMRIGPKNP